MASLTTSVEVWAAIERTYTDQSRARAINVRLALATTVKGNMNAVEYVNKMRGYADEMASAGKTLDDEEIVSYILVGLDMEYKSFVTSVVSKIDTVFVAELTALLIVFEAHLELLQGGG